MTFRSDHVDELISASLKGDLTDAERAELDAHLARCERCRATLAAFRSERRILAALPPAEQPRDLSARVRAGIDRGRPDGPWWRRRGSQVPLLASAAVFAAVVLSVVYFGHLLPPLVGQASGSPLASLSMPPSASGAASGAPSPGPSTPATFLGRGQLGYLELTGASFQASKLSFINDATGASIDLGVAGPPLAASLSPDGQWLAYITQKGQTGANEVWAALLNDRETIPLHCSVAAPFTDRLEWNWNSSVLAYTIASVDIGPSSGCPADDGKVGTTEPRVWQSNGEAPPTRGSRMGPDSYAADVVGVDLSLIESHAGATPTTTIGCWFCNEPPQQTIEGVFLPLEAPDGSHALFWRGTMASVGGFWQFSRGGMPQLSGDLRSAGPASPWIGTPLFSDLTPVGGEAFATGKFTWGPDSDLFAFWDGAWTGAPQSADGSYPSQRDVYVGRVSTGLLSAASRLPLTLEPNARIVDVTFSPDGLSVAVTIGLASAGIGDPPSAYLQIVPLGGGDKRRIGGGVTPPWDGPAVYGR